MEIKIKSFRGVPVVNGFFPKDGVRIRGGDTYKFNDDEIDLFEELLEKRGDLVEIVSDRRAEIRMKAEEEKEKRKPGRPRKEASEEVQSG